MKKLVTALLISSAALSGTAFAKDLCDVPEDQWQSKEALEQAVTDKGWTVKKIKVDEGCYEVYGKDENGKKVEAYFDPKSFEIVEMKD